MVDRFSKDIARRQQNKIIIEQERKLEQQQEEEKILPVQNQAKLTSDQTQQLTSRLTEDARKRKDKLEALKKEKEQQEIETAQQLRQTKHTVPKSEKLAQKIIKDPVYERLNKDADQRMQKQKKKLKEMENQIKIQAVPKINPDKRAKSANKVQVNKNEAIEIVKKLQGQNQDNNEQINQYVDLLLKEENEPNLNQSKNSKIQYNVLQNKTDSENQRTESSNNEKQPFQSSKSKFSNQNFIRPESAQNLVSRLLKQSQEALKSERTIQNQTPVDTNQSKPAINESKQNPKIQAYKYRYMKK